METKRPDISCGRNGCPHRNPPLRNPPEHSQDPRPVPEKLCSGHPYGSFSDTAVLSRSCLYNLVPQPVGRRPAALYDVVCTSVFGPLQATA